MHDYQMLINGARVDGENGHFDVVNPATATVFAAARPVPWRNWTLPSKRRNRPLSSGATAPMKIAASAC